MIGVGRAGELRLDDLAGYGDRVVLLEVEVARGRGDDVGGRVEPGVGREGLAVDLDRGRGLRACRFGCGGQLHTFTFVSLTPGNGYL